MEREISLTQSEQIRIAKERIALLALGAIGVVYGDIGTSPLYAIKECFAAGYGLEPTADNAIGVCSLVFWSILLVVVLKYIFVVMRADNKGEGGILALLALVTPKGVQAKKSKTLALTVFLALLGTALLAADGTITPAISVLSAVEGLEVAAPHLHYMVIPLTVLILTGLFAIQKRGTMKISTFFGPIMLTWFMAIAIVAIPAIWSAPGIFASLNPFRGLKLLLTHGWGGFLVLGAVVLCITGVEALYADMGHFGRKPITYAWFGVVYPCLILNYMGQGANIMRFGADAAANPFFSLTPGWTIYPMVILAAVATVVASQALISGSFSLGQQAVQLGYSPRLTVVHTSGHAKGQIFIPEINLLLMVACIALVFIFRSSSALAGAYGISVMGTMTITSILIYRVARRRWRWKAWKARLLLFSALAIDLPFLAANLPKVFEGGWFPLVICAVAMAIMTTWKRGRTALVSKMAATFGPVENFVQNISESKPHRVRGAAVFMTSNPRVTPPSLLHHFKHNQVLHDQIVLLSIVTEDVPFMPLNEILDVTPMGEGFYEVVARYGFMQSPKIERIFRLLSIKTKINFDETKASFYLGRDVLLINGPEKMARWRKVLFAFLLRNSLTATAYFGIPADRVVELGMQVRL